jgi:hypothetical protein
VPQLPDTSGTGRGQPLGGALVVQGTQALATIMRHGSSLSLEAEYNTSDASQLRDGDVYLLRLTSSAGTTVYEVTRAARYSESRPNGQDCPPVCRTANFD